MKRSTLSAIPGAGRRKTRPLGSTAISVRDRIIDTVRNIDRNEAQVVAEVRRAVAGGLRDGRALVTDAASVIDEVVRGSVAATLQAGTGMLTAIKAVAQGVVLGVTDAGGDVLSAALTTTRSAVETAAAAGANVPAVAWRTVGGLLEAGAEVGANANQVAAAAARGAVEGAGSVGRQATELMRSGFVSVSQSIARVFETGEASATAHMPQRGRPRKAAPQRAAKKPAQRKPLAKKSAGPKPVAARARRRAGQRAASGGKLTG
jgi:hypothetical protein